MYTFICLCPNYNTNLYMELNALGRYIYLNRINKTILCNCVGMTRATLYRNMEGKLRLPFDKVEQIADVLKVDINEFRESTNK